MVMRLRESRVLIGRLYAIMQKRQIFILNSYVNQIKFNYIINVSINKKQMLKQCVRVWHLKHGHGMNPNSSFKFDCNMLDCTRKEWFIRLTE